MAGMQQHIPAAQWQSLHGIHTVATNTHAPWTHAPRRYRHAGLITAAGASSRMGTPKALLPLPDRTPLAEHQSNRLKQAGCERVLVVVGAQADTVQPALANCETVINPQWATGRLSSIRAGLKPLSSFDGCFIMPVDAYGVSLDTFKAMREVAETGLHAVVRPTYKATPGHVVWIAQRTLVEVLATDTAADTPMHALLAPHTHRLPVPDPAILRNLNTPAEWARALAAEESDPTP